MLNGMSGKHVDEFWSLKELKVLKLKQYFLRDETAGDLNCEVTWKIRQMTDIANISVTSLGYSVWCALDPVSSTGAWLDRPLNWGTKWKALPKLLLLKLQQRGLEIVNMRRRFDTVRGFFFYMRQNPPDGVLSLASLVRFPLVRSSPFTV